MFVQFQARYPTGSLNSELVSIYQGKFVVRVSIQVEGVTLATGMAAAETVEVAEDRARSRALMVLGIQPDARLLPQPSALVATATEVQIQEETAFVSALPPQKAPTAESGNRNYGFSPDTPLVEATTPAPATLELPKNAPLTATLSESEPGSEPQSTVENLGLLASETREETPVVPFSKATSLFSPNYKPQVNADVDLDAKTETAIAETIDLPAAIARTTIELKRLGWTNKQGRDYLERTYGVRSRQQLDNDQMLEFLHYLESQPSPSKG